MLEYLHPGLALLFTELTDAQLWMFRDIWAAYQTSQQSAPVQLREEKMTSIPVNIQHKGEDNLIYSEMI